MDLAGLSGIMRRASLLAVVCVLVAPAMAQGSDRWTVAETEAQALLPSPRGHTQVTGAALSCATQRWRLEISTGGEITAPDATMTVDGRAFLLGRIADADGLSYMVPRQAIEPLKAGLRLELAMADEVTGFSLRGSKLALAAVQERCTPRDMSAYTKVTFTPWSSYMNLGRELRQADIAAFRLSTASEPKLDVAMAEFGEGRRLLLTRLCGSSWYYGASGCNITGFAPKGGSGGGSGGESGGEGWVEVYDTENVILHSDPAMVIDGWPDLVTIPAGQKGNMVAGPGLIWRWDGKNYALKGELPEEADIAEPQRGVPESGGPEARGSETGGEMTGE